jgi:hypothetical protein
MSIDTVFKPAGPLTQLSTSAVQICPPGTGSGIYTFRVRCLATAYFSWGRLSTITALGAPVAGTNVSENTIGMTIGGVEIFEIPGDSFFISSVAAAFEFCPGSGA